MAKTYFGKYQNPTYPEDQDMTAAEIEAGAREASMARAQSPNPLTCVIEGVWSTDEPFHTHSFAQCMEYRHKNVIGDDDPWIYWQNIDGPLIGPKPPPPSIPVGMTDWQVRAAAGKDVLEPPEPPPEVPPPPSGQTQVWVVRTQVNAGTFDDGTGVQVPNTPEMNFVAPGWGGWTFAVWISPDVIKPLLPGLATRVTVVGSFIIDSLYLGETDLEANPDGWIAKNWQRFTFDGGWQAVATMNDDGSFNPLRTDPLPIGFDATNGFWLSGYINPNGDGIVGGRENEPGWGSYYDESNEDTSANPDKSTYTIAMDMEGSVVILMIEGFYNSGDLIP